MFEFLKYFAILVFPVGYLVLTSKFPALRPSFTVFNSSNRPEQTPAESAPNKPLKSIMQSPRTDLAPPKDDPFTTEQLKQFDGSDSSKPIYVAIKGQ